MGYGDGGRKCLTEGGHGRKPGCLWALYGTTLSRALPKIIHRGKCGGAARQIPRPAGENAGLRDDAFVAGRGKRIPQVSSLLLRLLRNDKELGRLFIDLGVLRGRGQSSSNISVFHPSRIWWRVVIVLNFLILVLTSDIDLGS